MLCAGSPIAKRCIPLFLKLEFTKLIERYRLSPEEHSAAEYQDAAQPEQVVTTARWDELFAGLQAAPGVAVLVLPGLDGVALPDGGYTGPAVGKQL